MKRRQAVSTMAVILGGSMVGSQLFLTGCKQTEKKGISPIFHLRKLPYWMRLVKPSYQLQLLLVPKLRKLVLS